MTTSLTVHRSLCTRAPPRSTVTNTHTSCTCAPDCRPMAFHGREVVQRGAGRAHAVFNNLFCRHNRWCAVSYLSPFFHVARPWPTRSCPFPPFAVMHKRRKLHAHPLSSCCAYATRAAAPCSPHKEHNNNTTQVTPHTRTHTHTRSRGRSHTLYTPPPLHFPAASAMRRYEASVTGFQATRWLTSSIWVGIAAILVSPRFYRISGMRECESGKRRRDCGDSTSPRHTRVPLGACDFCQHWFYTHNSTTFTRVTARLTPHKRRLSLTLGHPRAHRHSLEHHHLSPA
jgi:hypothetical protein